MITVIEASRKVMERVRSGARLSLPLPDAAGFVLAEDISCSRDSPPHDKALVDGYAIRSDDVPAAGADLRVIEEVTAGRVPEHPVVPGSATRIMTGAPVPKGADAVVMFERTQSATGKKGQEHVRIVEGPVRAGQNIMRRGEAMRMGETVLEMGHRLRGIEIGLLAELGLSQVRVFAQPTVAVLSTGDELVGYEQTPSPGEIRNSNGPMLVRLVVEAGARPRDLGIARDLETTLEQGVRIGLDEDVLLLSGGVSAGVLDLVPRVLAQLGVVEVFHKVEVKPGKPIWFGVYEHSAGRETLVFGLPGNPVSGLVCFHLFVRPALRGLAGEPTKSPRFVTARLGSDYHHRGDRPTYFPGRTVERDSELVVEPLNWRGSADLRTLADADALIHFPAGDRQYRANDPVGIYWL